MDLITEQAKAWHTQKFFHCWSATFPSVNVASHLVCCQSWPKVSTTHWIVKTWPVLFCCLFWVVVFFRKRFWEEGKNTSGNCQFSPGFPTIGPTTCAAKNQKFRLAFQTRPLAPVHVDTPPRPPPRSATVLPLWPYVLTPRCWRVSRSACRPTSAFTSTRACCRAARPSVVPPRAASAPWPWGSRPPTRPLVTHWCTAATCSLRSTSSHAAPSRFSRRTWWWPSWVSQPVAQEDRGGE